MNQSSEFSQLEQTNMPRCLRGPRGPPEGEAVPQELKDFWSGLPLSDRKRLLRVDKKALFQRIRTQYCSRCFGLFAMRYDELRGSAALDCPACMEFYSGLVVTDGQLTLEEKLVHTQPGPFAAFAEAHSRERERELQFMTGDICGSGWQKRPGVTMCALHTSPVPYEAIAEYWHGLPEDHQTALFRLREEDFCAELDAHLKYQLRICRDCRGNVLRAFKELKPGVKKVGGTGTSPVQLEVCEGHTLKVDEGMVFVETTGSAAAFFERAEEVEESKASEETELGDEYDNPDHVRHAETPELAREALVDSVVLIYKSQVEVAFREQTAGHNALLLFVHLALSMMEEQVLNEYKELEARRAEAELLDLVAKEEEKKARKGKRRAKKGVGVKAGAGAKGLYGCSECAALQSCSPPGSPRTPLSPRSLSPLQRSPSPQLCSTAHPAGDSSAGVTRQDATASASSSRARSSSPEPAPSPALADTLSAGWEVQNGKRRGSSGAGITAGLGRKAPPPAQEHLLQAHVAVQMPVLHRASSSSAASASSAPSASSHHPARPGSASVSGATVATGAGKHAGPTRQSSLAPWAAVPAPPHPRQKQHQEQVRPEWTPWSSQGVGTDIWAVPGTSKLAHHPVSGQEQQDGALLAHNAFSLFHNSPVSPRRACASNATTSAHGLQQSNQQELRAYQLFGASQGHHPLAPLLRVPF